MTSPPLAEALIYCTLAYVVFTLAELLGTTLGALY